MGGKPVPVPTSEMILCIPDLEREGSKKLEKGLRGELSGIDELLALGR